MKNIDYVMHVASPVPLGFIFFLYTSPLIKNILILKNENEILKKNNFNE